MPAEFAGGAPLAVAGASHQTLIRLVKVNQDPPPGIVARWAWFWYDMKAVP